MKKSIRPIALLVAVNACFSANAYAAGAVTIYDLTGVNLTEEETTIDHVPENYDEAVAFVRKYGRSAVFGNTVCIVEEWFRQPGSSYYAMEFSKDSDVKEIRSEEIFYEGEDKDKGYMVFCFEMSENQILKSDLFMYFIIDEDINDKRLCCSYSFSSDSDLNISDISEYSWLPDSVAEHDAFIKKYGQFSCLNGYINDCSAYSHYAKYEHEWTGSAEIEAEPSAYVTLSLPDSEHALTLSGLCTYLFKPKTPGVCMLTATMYENYAPESRIMNKQQLYFSVDKDLNASEISMEEFMEQCKGDANGDGVCNLTDCTALRKRLIGMNEDGIKNWKAVDYNGDDKLNIIDFCMMKNEFLS